MKLPRRIFLQGLGGAMIGLPLLEAQEAYAEGSSTPDRFIVFFEHGGTLSGINARGARLSGNGAENGVDGWDPADFTEQLKLGLIHSGVLAGLESSLLLPRSLDNRAAMAQQNPGNPGGGHHISNATALTAGVATRAPGSTLGDFGDAANFILSNPSIDGLLAARLKQRHPVPFTSLNFDVASNKYGTYGSPFYSPHATDPSKVVPTALEFNPIAVFNRVFPPGYQPTPTDGGVPTRSRESFLRESILDGTEEQLKAYKSRVSGDNLQTIEAHLEHLRSIELRLAALDMPMTGGGSPVNASACVLPNTSSSPLKATDSRASLEGKANVTAPLLVDIGLAALRCGRTNVVTLNIPDMTTPWTNPTYVKDLGHAIGHSSRTTGATGSEKAVAAAWRATFIANRKWRMGLFAQMLRGLQSTMEGNGRTMLDNAIALETSEFSNAGQHTSYNTPVILAGGKGVLRTGRFVDFNRAAASNPRTAAYDSNSSLHNLYTTILRAFGYNDAHFGAKNQAPYEGVLSGLLV